MRNRYRILFRRAFAMIVVMGLANCGGGGGDMGNQNPLTPAVPPSSGTANPPAQPPQQTIVASVVAMENAKTGSASWQLSNPATAHEIEGYASDTSVNRGGSIDFMVNTSAATFNVDVYRMGWYGGSGARLMQSFANIPRAPQPLPCLNPAGVIECNWTPNLTLTVPDIDSDPNSPGYWASGIYLAKLTANTSPRKESYIIFVVRDDNRGATYVSQLPVTTYQAYNYWGGKSLYTGCEVHDRNWRCVNGALPSPAVSFNRPYGASSHSPASVGLGAGEFLTNVQPIAEGVPISSAGFDYNIVRWMERQGYDVKYITNLDLHDNGAVLNQAKAFISTGHDEYYSKLMWDRLVAARSAGINLAFFSANQIYWQVRFVDGSFGSNRSNRIMICYRGGGDPVTDNELTTDQFRWLGRPEAALIGNQYGVDSVMGDVTVTNAAHWLYAGTGAVNGMQLKGLLGYEINGFVPGVSPPQTRILARSPWGNTSGDMTYYVDASSAQVFATGSMHWSWGLDDYVPNGLRPNYESATARIFTANVFDAVGEKNLFSFTNANSSLDLSTSASLEPAPVMQAASPTGAQKNNRWRLLALGESGYYLIVSRANGLCLEAGSAAEGNQIRTQDCRDADNQKWRVADAGGNVALIEKQGGRCLDVPGASRAAGSGLTAAACNAASSQQWLRKDAS